MTLDLDKSARSLGGAARKEKLRKWELAFVAMLGGSRRPITKDRRPSPEQVVRELRQEGVEVPIPWNVYVAVGLNGQMVPSTLSKLEQIEVIRQMGEVAGFAGFIIFNGRARTYTRRLLLDPIAQRMLDAAAEFFMSHWTNFEAEELQRRAQDAEAASLSAQVYIDPDGITVSMYYSFQRDKFPPPGSTRVGIVYLVDPKKAAGHYQEPKGTFPWLVRWHSEQPRNKEYKEILEDAKQRFEKVVCTLQEIQAVPKPR